MLYLSILWHGVTDVVCFCILYFLNCSVRHVCIYLGSLCVRSMHARHRRTYYWPHVHRRLVSFGCRGDFWVCSVCWSAEQCGYRWQQLQTWRLFKLTICLSASVSKLWPWPRTFGLGLASISLIEGSQLLWEPRQKNLHCVVLIMILLTQSYVVNHYLVLFS